MWTSALAARDTPRAMSPTSTNPIDAISLDDRIIVMTPKKLSQARFWVLTGKVTEIWPNRDGISLDLPKRFFSRVMLDLETLQRSIILNRDSDTGDLTIMHDPAAAAGLRE